MHSNIHMTKHMIAYAKRHELTIPSVSVVNPVWGSGKRKLAWRVSGHLQDHGRNIAQSAQKTERLDHYMFPLTLGQKIISSARSELGVTESPAGSNTGPRVKVYQSSTGMYGQPWCASFVTWVLQKNAVKLPKFAWAWVPAWTANRNRHPLIAVAKTKMRPGDIVTLWNDAHIEFFEKWIIKGVLAQCIGGNTAPAGKQANGGMVSRTRRYTYEMKTCIHVVHRS